jgi:hypothetical protein
MRPPIGAITRVKDRLSSLVWTLASAAARSAAACSWAATRVSLSAWLIARLASRPWARVSSAWALASVAFARATCALD